MAVIFIVFISSLVAAATAQQRPVPPAFARASALQSRATAPALELEPHQPLPQPFRRTPLPLYKGRGFSLDGQEPKPFPLVQAFQPRPSAPAENKESARAENNEDAADEQQPTRQAPQQPAERIQQQQAERAQQQQAERAQQQQAERAQQQTADRIQQLQVDRIQQQQADRIQQQQADRIQQQPEKQFSGFRAQPQQIQLIEAQPQYVKKAVQRPLKRVHQVPEETAAASRSPETIQKLKLERTESADKQRAKKPVSQVLRRYRDDNPDGSITWGFENDDGTFKEETIGVDCVTRGKYGYVDPEGVKREYTYQTGVLCDKNRNPLQQSSAASSSSSAVEEAQASDTYGYIDYTKNQYVMANGNTINLNGMARNRARKPVPAGTTAVRKTARIDY